VRSRRSAAVLGALVAVAALVVTACSSSGSGSPVTVVKTRTPDAPSTQASSPSAPASSTSSSAKPGAPVHVSSGVISDGSQVGVGLPIILLLSRPIRDARAFAAATKVTVNGTPVSGGWYFERKYGDPSHPIEADYRMANYWPGHAQIHLDLPVKGVSAGPGLSFDDNLTLDFTTGAANVLTVDDATHKVSVVSDGKAWGTFPTSLGASDTPTKRGVKVIMEKGNSICMSGPGYHECGIKWTQRLTYDGEYLHSAPWNTYNIGHGVDSSNGCTNLYDQDAKKLYDFLEIGDVVNYPNANGPRMTLGEGYGDWNLSWQQWQTGGLYPTR
jgi:lipoprotein-anchoring transpeptidase ErfK/SrfK